MWYPGIFSQSEAKPEKINTLDWDKVARIIIERDANSVDAALYEDMSATRGYIYHMGRVVFNNDACVSSTWATPVIYVDGYEIKDVMKEVPFDDQVNEWPQSALDILKEGE